MEIVTLGIIQMLYKIFIECNCLTVLNKAK